jgi:hypothetical protein
MECYSTRYHSRPTHSTSCKTHRCRNVRRTILYWSPSTKTWNYIRPDTWARAKCNLKRLLIQQWFCNLLHQLSFVVNNYTHPKTLPTSDIKVNNRNTNLTICRHRRPKSTRNGFTSNCSQAKFYPNHSLAHIRPPLTMKFSHLVVINFSSSPLRMSCQYSQSHKFSE